MEEAPTPHEAKSDAAGGLPAQVPQARAVPDHVRARFVQVGRDYHFQSGAPAFRDDGRKLVSHSENVSVVHALVDIAIERGWQDLTVSGTARFRHDAWRIASLAGLMVRGYQPSEFEKQKLAREFAESRETGGRPESQAPVRRSPVSERAHAARSAELSSASRNSSAPGESAERQRIYSGKLLKHGPAPYKFHPHGDPSYYMQIETRRGPTILWGKDLERALRAAKVSPGEEVRVQQSGRETVTVKRRRHDQSGRVLDERDVQAHRNQWEVRRDADLNMHPHTVYEQGQNPGGRESGSASLALKGAQLFA